MYLPFLHKQTMFVLKYFLHFCDILLLFMLHLLFNSLIVRKNFERNTEQI